MLNLEFTNLHHLLTYVIYQTRPKKFPEVMNVESAQHPELVIVNRNQRCSYSVHTQGLHTLYIPSVHYLFTCF